ncbi:hypothetical protein [Streptomyces sp. Caat 7-52]|uniref:hypothetical protein n=1 Tax=Streptomyces sp. Caat 7-52 TaxID=2949637 RepID=UPI002034B5E0|nr:hypothetical protein [Streptomyces sp. Caat 7-52]
MTSVLRHRYGRAIGSGILCVALLSGGTAGAFAASPSPSPSGNGSASPTGTESPSPKGTASPSPTGKTSITATPGKSSVKAGSMVTFTGRTKGLKVGSPLVLQHEKNGKWTALKATAKVKTGNSYALVAKLNDKGTQHLRVASATKEGKVHSPTVTVTVN